MKLFFILWYKQTGLVYVSNPCTFGGYEYIHNDTHVLVGSGDSSHCVKYIEQALWGLEHQYDDDNKVTKTPNATDLVPLSQGIIIFWYLDII